MNNDNTCIDDNSKGKYEFFLKMLQKFLQWNLEEFTLHIDKAKHEYFFAKKINFNIVPFGGSDLWGSAIDTNELQDTLFGVHSKLLVLQQKYLDVEHRNSFFIRIQFWATKAKISHCCSWKRGMKHPIIHMLDKFIENIFFLYEWTTFFSQ